MLLSNKEFREVSTCGIVYNSNGTYLCGDSLGQIHFGSSDNFFENNEFLYDGPISTVSLNNNCDQFAFGIDCNVFLRSLPDVKHEGKGIIIRRTMAITHIEFDFHGNNMYDLIRYDGYEIIR